MKAWQSYHLLILLVASAWLLHPVKTYAEELQITDYLGLIRAQRNVTGKVDVRITVLRSKRVFFDEREPGPLLSHRTGFSGDIEAAQKDQNTYIFTGVSPGVWRIRLRNKALLLDAVEILGESLPVKGETPLNSPAPSPVTTQIETIDLKK